MTRRPPGGLPPHRLEIRVRDAAGRVRAYRIVAWRVLALALFPAALCLTTGVITGLLVAPREAQEDIPGRTAYLERENQDLRQRVALLEQEVGLVPAAPAASRSTSSYLENPLAAHTLLMKRMKCGVQAVIYVDDPAWETFTLINEIHRLLGMKRPAWTVPLGLARPIARASGSNEDALATTGEWHVRERWGAKAAATELP